MNFFIKTRGSVSVFLIIILVPMIVITTIFIDASRIKLAQEFAATINEVYGKVNEFVNGKKYDPSEAVAGGAPEGGSKRYIG